MIVDARRTIKKMYEKVRTTIIDSISSSKTTWTDSANSNRTDRSILTTIGAFIGGLFGLAKNSNVIVLRNTLNEVIKHEKHLTGAINQDTKLLRDMLKFTNSLINDFVGMIRTDHQATIDSFDDIQAKTVSMMHWI
jgi:hypothetical protein